jgi:hypothetical protein
MKARPILEKPCILPAYIFHTYFFSYLCLLNTHEYEKNNCGPGFVLFDDYNSPGTGKSYLERNG